MSGPSSASTGTDAVATEADGIAAAVEGCPAVVSLYSRGLPQVTTYLPGRRVSGVRLDEQSIEVAVVGRYGVPVAELAAQVRSAVAPYAQGRTIDVRVADIQTPEDDLQSAQDTPALSTGPG